MNESPFRTWNNKGNDTILLHGISEKMNETGTSAAKNQLESVAHKQFLSVEQQTIVSISAGKNDTLSNFTIWQGLVIVILVTVICVILRQFYQNARKPKARGTVPCHTKDTSVTKPTPPAISKPDISIPSLSIEGLESKLSTYCGLYEPMYTMACGKRKYRIGIMGDWVQRTQNLPQSLPFRASWLSLLEGFEQWEDAKGGQVARSLIAAVTKAGAVRDGANTIITSDDIKKDYDTMDGMWGENGVSMLVVSACWKHQQTLLEKGILMPLRKE